MKSTKKILSTSVEFTVEFNKDDFEPARLKALERLARDVKIPGFRNGKAPANVVEQHVNPNDLASHTLDLAVRTAIPKLFDGANVVPVSIPHVDVKKYIPGEMAEIVVKADIMPEVKLAKFDQLKASREQRIVADEDIEDVLKRIAESYAEPSVVQRAAAAGDEVIIDFTGKKDGVAFEGGSAKDYHLRLGSGQFIPGFEDGIIGHEVGEKLNLDLIFPADYASKELAGAKTVFEVLIKQVNEVKTPEINDDLAKKSGAFATLAELRDDIKKNLQAQADHEAEEKYKDDLLNELVDGSKTEAPETLVEEQVGRIKEDMLRNLQNRGLKIENYLEQNGQTEAQWTEEVRKNAERRVISSIIVQKLADELKVEVDDAAVEKQVAEMRAVYKNDANAVAQLNDPQVVNSIRNRMRINATMDKLIELNKDNAKVIKRPAFPKTDAAKGGKKSAKSAKTTKAAAKDVAKAGKKATKKSAAKKD